MVTLLASRYANCIQIIRQPSGRVEAFLGNRVVPLYGLPSHLFPEHMERAKRLLQPENSSVVWNSTRKFLQVVPKLLGGGNCFSASRRETPSTVHQELTNDVAAIAIDVLPINPVLEENPLWRVFPLSDQFTGRENLLLQIGQKFKESSESGCPQVVLSGLGGVGKTSLSTAYLNRNREKYPLAWTISAERPLDDFKKLGHALQILNPQDKGDKIVEVVVAYLEAHPGWILLFDNAETSEDLLKYFPSKGGHILVTTRNPHWKNGIDVGIFSLEESIDLLKKITGQTESAPMRKLTETLGHLPLALVQAGSYMKATGTSCKDYLSLFKTVRTDLWSDEQKPGDYPDSVATTWLMSVKKIREVPGALDALRKAAYLDPNNIPKILLGSDQLAFHVLQRYSLMTVGQTEGALSIHRLVQSVTQDQLSKKDRTPIFNGLLASFKTNWYLDPNDPRTWPALKPFAPHLETFCMHGAKMFQWAPKIVGLLGEVGIYLTSIEINLKRAITCLKEAAQLSNECFNSNDPRSAFALNNLGEAYSEAGDVENGLKSHLKALEIRKEAFGDDSLPVAESLANIGAIHHQKKKLEKALSYTSQALTIHEKYKDRPTFSMAKALNNFATIFAEMGQKELAAPLFAKSLEITAFVYGEDHPSYAAALDNLGAISTDPLNPSERLTPFLRALEIRKRVYGKDHPDVAWSLNNLGTTYLNLEDFKRAENAFREALTISIKVFGPTHPTVATTWCKLGDSLLAQQDNSNAEEAFKKALEIGQNTLREDHPDLAFTYTSLGDLYGAKKDGE